MANHIYLQILLDVNIYGRTISLFSDIKFSLIIIYPGLKPYFVKYRVTFLLSYRVQGV